MKTVIVYVLLYVLLFALVFAVLWAIRCKRHAKKDGTPAKKDHHDAAQTGEHRNISELLDYLNQRLGIPLPEFRVQNFEYFFERLTYEAHEPGAVASVTDQVLRHYRLEPSKVQIETAFCDRKPERSEEVRGQFQNSAAGYGKVRIVLKPEDSEFDTVIAIIMHECAHYFSEIHHTKLDDPEENERPTDVSAIWLGAGERMLRGCFPRANVQLGYLTKDECQYAVRETERRRQAAIAESEAFRQKFAAEAAAQTAGIDMAGRALETEPLCGEENQEKLLALKEKCRQKQKQLAKILTQLEHAMSEHAYCEMNALLLQTAQAAREELDPMLGAFKAFQALTMKELQIDRETYAYYAAACEHARGGNRFAQFEMLQFYNAHPSALASEEAKYLIGRLEKSDTADAHYLLGRCWNEGICVPADRNAAVRCWVQAAGLGSEQAEQALRELHKEQAETV